MELLGPLGLLILCVLSELNGGAGANNISPSGSHGNQPGGDQGPPVELFAFDLDAAQATSARRSGGAKRAINNDKRPSATFNEKSGSSKFPPTRGKLLRVRKSSPAVLMMMKPSLGKSRSPPPAYSQLDLTSSEDSILRLLSLIASKDGVNIFPGNPDFLSQPSHHHGNPESRVSAMGTGVLDHSEDSDEDDGAIELGYYGSDLSSSHRPEYGGSSRKNPNRHHWPRGNDKNNNNNNDDGENGWIDIYSHRMMRRSGRAEEDELPRLNSAEELALAKLILRSGMPIQTSYDPLERKLAEGKEQRSKLYALSQLLNLSQDLQQTDLPVVQRQLL